MYAVRVKYLGSTESREARWSVRSVDGRKKLGCRKEPGFDFEPGAKDAAISFVAGRMADDKRITLAFPPIGTWGVVGGELPDGTYAYFFS